MSKINELANDIARDLPPQGVEAAFDPTIIVVIAELLVPLIEALQECFEDLDDEIRVVNDPRPIHRLAARMKAIGYMGRREFRRNGGQDIVNAILEKGRELRIEELEELYREI